MNADPILNEFEGLILAVMRWIRVNYHHVPHDLRQSLIDEVQARLEWLRDHVATHRDASWLDKHDDV